LEVAFFGDFLVVKKRERFERVYVAKSHSLSQFADVFGSLLLFREMG
jgi:hypothetical protein